MHVCLCLYTELYTSVCTELWLTVVTARSSQYTPQKRFQTSLTHDDLCGTMIDRSSISQRKSLSCVHYFGRLIWLWPTVGSRLYTKLAGNALEGAAISHDVYSYSCRELGRRAGQVASSCLKADTVTTATDLHALYVHTRAVPSCQTSTHSPTRRRVT